MDTIFAIQSCAADHGFLLYALIFGGVIFWGLVVVFAFVTSIFALGSAFQAGRDHIRLHHVP